ncbi:thioredoxin/protein disulfide isomerase [Lobosporangium transversale]|uniref:protein disulfide-isomerase n=1 Tax=Lobosporangium transversale TaxID=64571 RepID=A0A1Y2GL39_9FUNG|nr:thioredoxin/protein disulfide isomerase [Lobosporangium transversale]ORZ14289.1 thioredoxin/protein disulfide isomerase [Lobosporangium transversale]|eukprot:XP_021880767.1 thioredoxin/protein disulfide isomerase [Lobosporangium transversale]
MLGKKILFGVIATMMSFIATVTADSVLALTPSDFDKTIGSKPALVEFYAPWCGHCKALAPTYEELGQAFSDKQDKVLIAKVDADAHRELGSRYDIKGFPTIKWFPKGVEGDPEDYKGGRDLDALASFVTQKTGVKSSIVKAVPAVTVLTDATFDKEVLQSKRNTLVEFYAPWCGHCKNLAPTYEKVAQDFLNDKDTVVIANVDATVETAVAEKYGVKGYPTIKFFAADGTVEDYTGGRSEQDFVDFINQKTGTQRAAGGLLRPEAGRIGSLDELVEKFVKAASKEKKKISEQAIKLAEKLGATGDKKDLSAKYYSRFFEKALATANYAETEAARLYKIIKNKSVNRNRLDDFIIRHNIISLFIGKSSAEGKDKDEL